MNDEELHRVRNEIRATFPSKQYYGPITACDCDESKEIREELWHKRWDEIPTAFLDLTCSPTLLTPEAFQAFVPAYMLRGLDDLIGDRVVLEFTVYSLCPDAEPDKDTAKQVKETRLRARAKMMSPAQVQAIRSFLTFVAANAENRELLRPMVGAALDSIWF
ncbi:MAG TPA: DUF6714 family protein [Bryobacteraceae bacterium]|nr:DUF6714 family protein [Bryobacteraceae bacterium]